MEMAGGRSAWNFDTFFWLIGSCTRGTTNQHNSAQEGVEWQPGAGGGGGGAAIAYPVVSHTQLV